MKQTHITFATAKRLREFCLIESDGVHVYEGVAGVPITKHIKD